MALTSILVHQALAARRLTVETLRPVLSRIYRARQGRCPPWILRALGIATPGSHPTFSTVARLVDTMPQVEDAPVIECGVYRGASLLGIAHRLKIQRRPNVRVIGCDSFSGLPAPTEADRRPEGTYHDAVRSGMFGDTSRSWLERRIARLGLNVELVQGLFADSLPEVSAKRFSLVHLDCDLYESYLTCLKHLYSQVIPGGFIVFDEYERGSWGYPGAKRAIDEFLSDKPETLETLDVPQPRVFIRKGPRISIDL